ncbi:MAG TPA: DUF488 domain-containing protein [Candidatus Dormibacteraeota bacterium]
MTTVQTIGHGTLAAGSFAALLQGAGAARVVDVRSFPGSRRNPQFGREEMASWLPEAQIEYLWMPELGGRRRPNSDSRHIALRHAQFRAYADYMETDQFVLGVSRLLLLADERPTVVMCSESLWWRCHRRLLADYLALVRGAEVAHVLHDGRVNGHQPTDGVRLAGDRLIYDVGVTLPLPVL